MTKLRRTLHRFAHAFGWYRGRVYQWTDDYGAHHMGFRCDQCGDIEHLDNF